MKRRRFDDLPLFYKLLVPFVTLILIVGAFGAFLIVRDLSSRARATLDQELVQRSQSAKAVLLERELYLLESANLAANLEGMRDRVTARDAAGVVKLLRTVLALKTDLDLVVVTSDDGSVLAEFERRRGTFRLGTSTTEIPRPLLSQTLSDRSGRKHAGFGHARRAPALLVTAPICSGERTCAPRGAAIVGLRLRTLARANAKRLGDANGLSIYDQSGRSLASTSNEGADAPTEATSEGLVRRSEVLGGVDAYTLHAPFEVQGRNVGSFSVSQPSGPAFAAVRGAGVRLALLLLLALAGIVAIGAVISRRILSALTPLIDTNRTLAGGDLSARAPVEGQDEISELARGLNEMAERLQESHSSLEERVADRTVEVERLLAERTEFFASLSHELRTPIAVIIYEAKMMLDLERPQGTWWREPSQTIKESADQLLVAVNDILDLARLEVGGFRVDLEQLALDDVLGDLKPTVDRLAARAELDLTYRIDSALPRIRADRRSLREVVLNLVDNAVKYTPRGGGVEVAATAVNGHVTLQVKDAGLGIPEESIARIFDLFYRVPGVEPLHGQPSSGLGLALTKRLVEAQGATISVVSAQGQGSVFSVAFPAVPPSSTTP